LSQLSGSVISIGAAVGSAATAVPQVWLGQRVTLLFALPVALAAWVTLAASPNVWVAIAARAVQGLTVGFIAGPSNNYVAELAHSNLRGLLVGTLNTSEQLGYLLVYAVGSSSLSWRQVALVCGFLTTVLPFLGLLLLPDSPRWLAARHRLLDAHKALIFFRGPHYDSHAELVEITDQLPKKISTKNQFKKMRDPSILTSLLLLSVLFLASHFSGRIVVSVYLVPIFASAEVDVCPYTSAVIIGVVRVLATFLYLGVVERINRKPLFISSFLTCALALAMFGTFFYEQDILDNTNSIKWLPLASVATFCCFNNIGFSVLSLIRSEILPTSVRSTAVTVLYFLFYIGAFVASQTFMSVVGSLGKHGAFWLYCCFNLLMAVVGGLNLPETRRRSLEEITARDPHQPTKSTRNPNQPTKPTRNQHQFTKPARNPHQPTRDPHQPTKPASDHLKSTHFGNSHEQSIRQHIITTTGTPSISTSLYNASMTTVCPLQHVHHQFEFIPDKGKSFQDHLKPTQPSHTHSKSTQPSNIHNKSIQPFNTHNKSIQPSNTHNKSIQPSNIHNKSIQPFNTHNKSIQPAHIHNKSIQPAHIHNKSIQPFHTHNKSIQPAHIHNKSIQPAHIHNKSIQPFHTHNKSIQPSNTHNKSISYPQQVHTTLQYHNKSIQPVHIHNKSIQPVHIHNHTRPYPQQVHTTRSYPQQVHTTLQYPQQVHNPLISTTSPYNPPISTTSPYNPPIPTTSPYNQPISTTSPYNPSIPTTSPYNPSISTTSPYNPPIPTTSPYNPLISTTSPYNPPISTTSPYNPPIPTTSPYNQPISTTSPYNPPISTTSPYNPPIPTTSPYNPPISTTSPYNPPISTTNPYNPPISTTSPYNLPPTANYKSINERDK
ncbi:flocculation protein FLO11-like, partial [Homarus americanus]|uniref:flocculation protein FLO11-like n=1 Tax=Homarus americanus TaxID=6706 RepID=UPI001C480658